MNSLRILISGASGPVGAALVPFLKTQGHTVTRLVRTSARGQDQILWDPARPLSPDSVSGFDAVIHLAGESIVGRWTGGKKQRILDSRTQGTSHLAEAAAKAAQRPRVFISASAVGYYGDRGDEILTESSATGTDFLALVCRDWEAEASRAAERGIRLQRGSLSPRRGERAGVRGDDRLFRQRRPSAA